MIPQMPSSFLNWSDAVQLKVISKTAVDFQSKETTLAVITLDMVIQPMSSRKVERKPEGERAWIWKEAWSTISVERDTILQDNDGVQYRVGATLDWGAAGFYKIELVQQPKGLGQ